MPMYLENTTPQVPRKSTGPVLTSQGLRSPGYGGCAPLGPVVATLVPRCALLPAPTPRDALSAVGTTLTPIRLTAVTSGLDASTTTWAPGRDESVRNIEGTGGRRHPPLR